MTRKLVSWLQCFILYPAEGWFRNWRSVVMQPGGPSFFDKFPIQRFRDLSRNQSQLSKFVSSVAVVLTGSTIFNTTTSCSALGGSNGKVFDKNSHRNSDKDCFFFFFGGSPLQILFLDHNINELQWTRWSLPVRLQVVNAGDTIGIVDQFFQYDESRFIFSEANKRRKRIVQIVKDNDSTFRKNCLLLLIIYWV